MFRSPPAQRHTSDQPATDGPNGARNTWQVAVDEAALLFTDGRPASAILHLQRVLGDHHADLRSVDLKDILASYLVMGKCCAAVDDLDQAVSWFERALELCGGGLNPRRSSQHDLSTEHDCDLGGPPTRGSALWLQHLTVLSELANTCRSLGKQRSAFNCLAERFTLLKTLSAQGDVPPNFVAHQKIYTLSRLVEDSIALKRYGDTEQYATALVAEQRPSLQRAVSLSALSIAYYRLGQHRNALETATRAIEELYEFGADSDEPVALINAYRVKGWSHLRLQDFLRAEAAYTGAREVSLEFFDEEHPYSLRCTCDLAFTYYHLNKPYSAWSLLNPSLARMINLNESADSDAGVLLQYLPYLRLRGTLCMNIGETLDTITEKYVQSPRTISREHLRVVLHALRAEDLDPVIGSICAEHASREQLLEALQLESAAYLKRAAQDLGVTLRCFKRDYGWSYGPRADIYDQLKRIARSLGDSSGEFAYARCAERIRQYNEEQ